MLRTRTNKLERDSKAPNMEGGEIHIMSDDDSEKDVARVFTSFQVNICAYCIGCRIWLQ